MQIVEAIEGRVRVAELRLRRRGSPLQFALYPMIHIGSPAFYAEVSRRLQHVHLVVAEGVGDSRVVAGLTSVYVDAADPGLDLVVQPDTDTPGVPVLRPDMSGEHFDERWRTVPLWQRGLIWAGARGYSVAQRMVGSRLLLRELEDWSLEDLPTERELAEHEALGDVERVIGDERDALLLATLDDIHRERSGEAIVVAVVYGAAHMRAVVTGLRRHGYRVHAGEWLTVMET